MKHIKTYRIFESSSESMEEIKQYLEDIFRELEDMGFVCRVDINHEDTALIGIKHDKKFKYSIIKDYIESATDYMNSIGFDLAKAFIRGNWKDEDLNRLFIIEEELFILYEPKPESK